MISPDESTPGTRDATGSPLPVRVAMHTTGSGPPVASATQHPADRPAEPDHPMSLEGGFVPGDVALMVTCMVEELLQLGTPTEEIRRMSRQQNYQALFASRYELGDAAMDDIIDDAGRRVGVHRHRDREHTGDVQGVTLSIGGSLG
jgi:hypothetical protein